MTKKGKNLIFLLVIVLNSLTKVKRYAMIDSTKEKRRQEDETNQESQER